MRSRVVRPSFFLDERLASLPALTRIFFLGLMTVCDREGRHADSPRRLAAEILPYEPDTDVEAMLTQLAEVGLIVRYQAGEGRFIEILAFAGSHPNTFWTHVYHKERASVLPAHEKTDQASGKQG